MLLMTLALAMVVVNLHDAANRHLVWTGVDGWFPVDQMQYLAWIRDASHHGLASDLFVLRPTAHDYLQPLVAISGGLAALGVAPWLALLLWKPVAVVALFIAVRAYCRRALTGDRAPLAALVLALFAAGFGVLADEWLPFWTWGYPWGLLGLASMIGALLAQDGALRHGRISLAAPALGLLASWIHPWQGELLIVILVAVQALHLRRYGRRGLWQTATVAAAAILPLAYYGILDRADPVWRLGHVATAGPTSLPRILLPLAPLLLAAAFAYRSRARGFLQSTARVWPLAALGVWAVNDTALGATPLHAWLGITIPLAVLAVEGVPGVRIRGRALPGWAGVIAVIALTVPGSAYMLSKTGRYIGGRTHNQNLITRSEQRALDYLATSQLTGGVLTSPELGDVVPGLSGRRTYVSEDTRWSTPHARRRERLSRRLFSGAMGAHRSQAFVRATGARFVINDCHRADLDRQLAPLISSSRRFGCVRLYVLRAS